MVDEKGTSSFDSDIDLGINVGAKFSVENSSRYRVYVPCIRLKILLEFKPASNFPNGFITQRGETLLSGQIG